ncbi:type III secretion system chaperone [Acidovorax sp. CCYZU-2555]|uniref:type III secretion system chaperone n=1 Tax=Acidovorax sp. CCYZU-2555 TaxID=2835042 RepID=UPI001BCDB1E4|nr:type III secretion system chaperone [Acidovorax sp. CCYZU-2555]MBS7778665.1 type III secretion system chaperone [Acidovorax sp. CCYZU-2555]
MNAIAPSQPYSPQEVLAQAFGLDQALLFDEAGQGRIQLDGALLHLQLYQEDANVLLLMADLGQLPVNDRHALHQQMLVANSGWSALAGGALCTNESGERALLRLRLDLNALNSEILTHWLTAFVTAAEHWAALLAAPAQAAPPSADELKAQTQNTSFLHPTHMA